jgi:Carboxypeptidase regulatory-like domain
MRHQCEEGQNDIRSRTRGALKICFCLMLLSVAANWISFQANGQAVPVAEVDGFVTDPTGQPVADAQVTMTETEKNQVHATASSPQDGRYSFPALPVGTYSLTISEPGFKKYVASGIVLEVASNISINA